MGEEKKCPCGKRIMPGAEGVVTDGMNTAFTCVNCLSEKGPDPIGQLQLIDTSGDKRENNALFKTLRHLFKR